MFPSREEEYEYGYGYEEFQPSPLDALKEHLPKLIALIVIAAIAYFAYKTFFLKYKVTITFVNTENKPIELLSGSLIDEKGNIIGSFIGSTLEAELKPGNYTIEFDPQNIYATYTINLTVSEDGSYQNKFIFEKNFPIEVVSLNFPEKIFAGQELNFEIIRYVSNFSKDLKLELKFESDAPFEIAELQPSEIILPPQIEVPVNFYLKVKPNFKPKKGECQKFSAKLKIRYLKENNPLNKKFEFSVCKMPSIKVKPKKLSFGKLTSAETSAKKIFIENPAALDLNLTLSIKITSTKTYPESVVEDWFFWKESNAKEQNILVPAEDSAEAELFVKIPELVENDSIKGNIIISGMGIEKKVSFSLTTKSPTINLSARLSETKFNLERIDSNLSVKEATLKIKNEGDVSLDDINISSNCSSDWIFIPEYTSTLEPNQSFTLKLKISAPPLAENITKNCLLKITYLNPFTQMKVTAESYDIEINIPK